MSDLPLVTIIVPMYNVEKYVGDSIGSAVGQAYQNVEVLCVNDGSTDETRKIAEQIVSGSSHAKIIDQVNQGLSAARNTGLAHAEGDFVFFLDADDMVPSVAIEMLVNAANEHQADIAASMLSDSEDYRDMLMAGALSCDLCFREATIDDFYYQKMITNHACGKLYSRSLFMEAGIQFPVGRSYEDIATSYRLFEAANGIVCTDSPLYYYRYNAAGITHTYSPKNIRDLVADYLEIKEAFGSHPSDSQSFYLLTILYTLLRLINKAPSHEEIDSVRHCVEKEYNEKFQIKVLNFGANRTLSSKLFLRRTALGKQLLRKWRK